MRRFIRRLHVVEVRRVHGLIATLLAVATLTGVSTRTARHFPTDSSIGQAEDAAHADAPTVWFTVTTPTSSATQSVTIHWCDDVSMVPNSRYFTVNGGVVSTDYTVGSDPGCTAYATSTVTVNLNLGSSALYAKIRGDNFEWGEATDVIVRENLPPPTYGVTVTPDGAEASVPFSTGQTQWFKLKNTGNQSTTFQVSATCFGAGIASGCTLSNSSKLVTGGATDSVSVSYTSGAVGTKGRIDIVADSGGVMDEAYVTVLPYGTSASNYPIVDLSNSHPGTTVERGDCLTISLGASAAYECGDVRFVHALPTVTTLSKARTPTMLFNSAHNRPTPVVAADVSLPSASGTPDSTVAKLTVDAALVATGSWPGAPWAGGASRRIGLSYSATTTGIKSFSLEVAFFIGGVRYATTKTGELAVVDRRSSAFGSGWWLAGLEQLQVVGNRVLWIGGDGSTRVYVDAGLVPSTGTRRWVAPAYDRPDSMFHDTTSGNYTRNLPGGLRVVFNGSGQHVSTVNRLNQTTSFAYSGGRLTTITVPPSSAATAYQFSYTGSNRLSSVAVRGPTGGSTRTTTVTDSAGLIKSILDPGDSVPVRFTYVSPSNANVLARKDRTGHSTVFGYDALNRVTLVADTVGAAVLRDTLTAAETRGQPGVASVRSDSVVSRHNGPRDDATDAVDVTTFAIDRHGAPALIRNALGYVTRIERGDIRWPGLATRVRSPNGRSVVALHDTRGNLRSTTDSSTVQSGVYAVSRFEWDQKWDFVTRSTTPMGVVTKAAYDAGNGNRLWQEDGRGSTSRANFSYWTTGIETGLLRSTELPGSIKDTVRYDAVLGNVAVTKTPKGYESKVTRDSIGRVLTMRAQIDTNTSVNTKATEQRFTYDLRDLMTASASFGAPHEGVDSQKVVVENSYDDERRPTRVRRKSDPDIESIGWIVTDWRYDAIGRRVAEIAGDGKVDSTFFNAAGSPDSVRTRRGHKIRFDYDALGRMLERSEDPVTYAERAAGIPQYTPVNAANTSYPRLLKNGSNGMTIPGEIATFTYDTVGNLLTADNADAKIRRTWWQNGLLKTETQKIQTYARDDTTKHVYTISYEYDLDGRRVKVKHPTQLAPRIASAQADSVLYAYDAQTGALKTVTDLLGNVFAFEFNTRNELARMAAPGSGLSDVFTYDSDGQLSQHATYDSSAATTDNHPGTQLRSTTLRRDARGKLLWTANTLGVKDTLRAHYTALGQLKGDTATDRGSNYQGLGVRADTKEFVTYDALGNNSQASSSFSGVVTNASELSVTYSSNDFRTDGTGRIYREYLPARTGEFIFDESGNLYATYTISGTAGEWADERVSYYDAGGSLVAADRRTTLIGSYGTLLRPQNFTFEEFRYDALGRRVLVRSRRWCQQQLTTAECAMSTIRRTVWDGSSELWEIQMPGHEGTAATTLENDTTALADQGMGYEDLSSLDKNPYYGRTGYTYGLALDQPLSLTRVKYTDRPAGGFVLKVWDPFTMIPHWNHRGSPDNGSFADGTGSFVDGTQWMCVGSGSTRRCVNITWPYGLFSYNRRSIQALSWHGTLLDQKRDETGTLYRRNRYVDPMTGRFTQQDPIGLAGGMNLYGYAGGDPVNFSDPFGLCPEKERDKSGQCRGGLQVAEWQAVTRAAGELEPAAKSEVLGLLANGKIRSETWLFDDVAGFANPLTGNIVLNTATDVGSVFEWSAGRLAFLLAHEVGHTKQYDQVGPAYASVIGIFDSAVHGGRTAGLDMGANAYACKVVKNAAQLSQACR